ncbi:alpha/beta fold hydrolase [Croceimicrobium hydrocarbonivorans]|uniref:Alpha/beta hydrolase n=1 Tax=Croceimicrobium hydrocarbonivorans TaxID=2761580 RepID=A0A7H0VEC0_9FLAO|nr:alpha/beta hydrolase [Croceimicrobium hydrocarbonivorans]QNR24068.1 alpha/beta hydrolase [Croceimicrobium hydrocarbonivorans]
MSQVNQSSISPINFPKPQLIPINGIELEVFEAGTENAGNPIVLCHGFPEHAYSWRFQIPALVNAGFHVIVPNQRGYGNSSRPENVEAYDIIKLCEDMVSLLDYFQYDNAVFMGHDWGANVVWNLALLHPKRVSKVINLALPYQERGRKPWLEMMEEFFGEDFYFVHFNRKPGVADAILEANTAQFISNLFRKNLPPAPPAPGMLMIQLAEAEMAAGDPILNEEELEVFVSAFQKSGFSGAINWYRNLDRNWHLMADVEARIEHPTLMVYGDRDIIPKSESLPNFAPNLEVLSLDCGHWIPQEKPEELNEALIKWLAKS